MPGKEKKLKLDCLLLVVTWKEPHVDIWENTLCRFVWNVPCPYLYVISKIVIEKWFPISDTELMYWNYTAGENLIWIIFLNRFGWDKDFCCMYVFWWSQKTLERNCFIFLAAKLWLTMIKLLILAVMNNCNVYNIFTELWNLHDHSQTLKQRRSWLRPLNII